MQKATALITGATSGIGKAYAEVFAQKGYHLILTGRREPLLREVALKLSKDYAIQVTICLVDFTDDLAFSRFFKFIETQKNIHILVNNAGYGTEHPFTEDDFKVQEDVIKVHILASIRLAHLVASQLKAKAHPGVIINVSSLASFIPLSSSVMYCSTKMFLTTFSEALAMELKPFSIKVQALCPGFVHTDFHSKLKINPKNCQTKGIVKWMEPKEVVDFSLKSLNKNQQVICVPGFWNQVAYHFLRHVPKAPYYFVASELGPKWFKNKV